MIKIIIVMTVVMVYDKCVITKSAYNFYIDAESLSNRK